MTEGPAPSTRLAPRWAIRIPLAFVVLSLAALIAIPWATARRLAPLQHDLSQLAEPSRGYVTQIHLAMAQQGSALDDYIDERDTMHLERYRAAELREREAYGRLIPLVSRLGATPRDRLDELRALETRWHAAVGRYVERGPGPEGLRHDPEQEDLYDRTLIAAARLDEAITATVRDRRSRIDAEEARQQRISALLALLALAAVAATGRLGQRVHAYALEAEQRRAALADAMASRARFMRGVSHDLKNPIHAIDGHAQLLESGLRGPLADEQRDSIARIRRSVRALTGLIEDLLELARAEAGQLTISPEPVVLHDVVHDVVEQHRAAAEGAGLALAYAPDGMDVVVVTDAARVSQVLGNLLSNAVKYTPSGGRVDVRAERSVRRVDGRPAPAIAIHVTDDGRGIPDDKREEIFGEFTRLRADEKPGAGLGLSIARRIARMLDGDITVSERGDGASGARFTLWLSLAPGAGGTSSGAHESEDEGAARTELALGRQVAVHRAG